MGKRREVSPAAQGIKQDGREGERRYDETSLEVLVKVEAITVAGALLAVGVLLLGAGHDTSLLVVTNTLLEEVGLASQGDGLHEVEGVRGIVVLLVAEGDQQTVGDELDVLAHQLGIHTKEGAGQSVRQELLLNADGFNNDILDHLGARTVVQVGEKQAGKVGVHALITRDQLVREGQAGHQATLLEPKDRGKRAGEEDTLNASKGNQTLSEGRVAVSDPLDGPFGLLGDAGNWGRYISRCINKDDFWGNILVSIASKR